MGQRQDLWADMRQYHREWGHNTKIFWVKGHAEKDGNQTDCHEVENKRADEDAERAYQHLDTPAYKGGYLRVCLSTGIEVRAYDPWEGGGAQNRRDSAAVPPK